MSATRSIGERYATEILGDAQAVRANLRPCTYLDIQSINAIEPFGARHYWSSTFVTDLDDELIDLLVAIAPTIPTPESGFLIEPMHGAARRRGSEHAAFANRSARFHVTAIGTWHGPSFDDDGGVVEPLDDGDDDRVVQWRAVRQLRDARRGRVDPTDRAHRIAPEPPTRPRSSPVCRP